MIIYQETKKQFLNDTLNDQIDEKLRLTIETKLKRKTSENEFRSWTNSMQYMYKVMSDERIPDECHIAIEYKIPNTNKRVDFIVCGENKDNVESAVIIELKQWDVVEKIESQDGIIKTRLQGKMVNTNHPSYQAFTYAKTIEDFNEDVRLYKISLYPCAYLHNYTVKHQDDLFADCYTPYIEEAPVFAKGDVIKLSEFISKHICKANKDVLYHIDHGKIKPSKSLQEAMVNLLKGKEEFRLLDEQKTIYEEILDSVRNQKDQKKVYIIKGGPGTGKTVIAINLLVGILNLDNSVLYVSKNQAPRKVYEKKLRDGNFKKVYIDSLFKGSGIFTNLENNVFDCLIIDEAHRLREKSGLYQNAGENQIKEIIGSTKTSIFFVDDYQMIDIKDIGCTDEIRKWGQYFNAEIIENELISQFRCNGSDSYLSWLEYVLQMNDIDFVGFEKDYDVEIMDSPQEVFEKIKEKNSINNKSRMLAGYCWNWISNEKNNPNAYDIEIGKFKKSWNLGSTNTWAIDEDSINEIGCIHTSQGLEFDYVGVIIGNDLRYEDNQIITDFTKRAKTDKSIFGLKSMYKKDPINAKAIAERIIKNTYRTLLSRGQKGCYIYCVDENLRNYLKEML